MKRIGTFFLTLFFLLPCFSTHATEYSKEVDFGPVRFTVEQIAKIANGLFSYMQNVNGPSNGVSGCADFISYKYNVTLDLPLKPEDYDKIPDNSYSFSLRATSLNGNVSLATLKLGDSYRYANISGNSHEHVTGFLSIIKDKIDEHEVLFGGHKFRVLLAVVFLTILFLAYLRVTWTFNSIRAGLTSLLVLITLQNGVTYLLPWEKIFPGTLITHEPISFLVKYSPLFTFLGFLIAAIPLACAFSKKIIKRNRPHEIRPAD